MNWDMEDNMDEARMIVKGIKDICWILDTPCVDVPRSVFMRIHVLCEHTLSLLPEFSKVMQEEIKEE